MWGLLKIFLNVPIFNGHLGFYREKILHGISPNDKMLLLSAMKDNTPILLSLHKGKIKVKDFPKAQVGLHKIPALRWRWRKRSTSGS